MGILNFLFVDPPNITHTDIGAYLKKSGSEEYATFYTISHIEKVLNELDQITQIPYDIGQIDGNYN